MGQKGPLLVFGLAPRNAACRRQRDSHPIAMPARPTVSKVGKSSTVARNTPPRHVRSGQVQPLEEADSR